MTVGANWAKSYSYRARELHQPTSVEQVRSLVASTPKIRALGSRHSFTSIADSPGDLVSVEHLPREVSVDSARSTARVSAGLRYGDLATQLQSQGWALHNLASLPHISLAGAVATSTHGSGDRNGTLASAVAAVEIVTADGELVTLRRGEADFDGSVVSLGALGVVTAFEIDVQPTYDVRQDVYLGLSWSALLSNFDDVMSSAYSVSIFTRWQGENVDMAWLKSRMDAAPPPLDLFGAVRQNVQLHMIESQNAGNTTRQGGVPGPWSDRLAHFRLEFTPSTGDELQSEYLVPRARAVEAIAAVRELNDAISPLLLTSELRTMAADSLWLSGAYETDAVGIHFTWKKLAREVAAVLPAIEDALFPLGARAHWGKVFTRIDDDHYPRLADFRALRDRFDPERKFDNEFLRTFVG
ncbi:MAG: FAD-binding protein [Microbacteriaceae bacterium]